MVTETCCCGCDHRTAAMIVGCLSTVFGIISTILSCILASNSDWWWVFSVSFGFQIILIVVSALLLIGVILNKTLLCWVFIVVNVKVLIYNYIVGFYLIYVGGFVAVASWGVFYWIAGWWLTLGIGFIVNSSIAIYYTVVVYNYVQSIGRSSHQQADQPVAIILQPGQPAMHPVMQPYQTVMQPYQIEQPIMQPYVAQQPGQLSLGAWQQNLQPNLLTSQPGSSGKPGPQPNSMQPGPRPFGKQYGPQPSGKQPGPQRNEIQPGSSGMQFNSSGIQSIPSEMQSVPFRQPDWEPLPPKDNPPPYEP